MTKNTNTTATRETIMADYKKWRTAFNKKWDTEQKTHSQKLATWKKELAEYLANRDAKLAEVKAAKAETTEEK